ncbi:TBC1 domain family member 31, partial [Fasciolopsis buskii]
LFIWRTVLQLPNNTQAFSVLVSKGVNPAHELLSTHYPVRDQKLMRVFQKRLNTLPSYLNIRTKSIVIIDFVLIFPIRPALLRFPVNWCFTWFEYFPNPPINVLCMVENLLAYTDPDLYNHFVRYDVTTEASIPFISLWLRG